MDHLLRPIRIYVNLQTKVKFSWFQPKVECFISAVGLLCWKSLYWVYQIMKQEPLYGNGRHMLLRRKSTESLSLFSINLHRTAQAKKIKCTPFHAYKITYILKGRWPSGHVWAILMQLWQFNERLIHLSVTNAFLIWKQFALCHWCGDVTSLPLVNS